MFIRTTVNKTGNAAVQVVEKVNRKNKILKHIGTAKSPLELSQLRKRAQNYIDEIRIKSGVVSFFDSRFSRSELANLLNRLHFTHALDTATYRFFKFFYNKIGFGLLDNQCFTDLVIARIIVPCSKRKTREILETRFGKNYSLSFIYRTLHLISNPNYRKTVESVVYSFLTDTLHEPLSLLFFDVTTLYFEAFDEDDIRKCGFSKDQKHNQPQIIVALMVTQSGMPVMYRMFEGNTFEGHTMLPCIEKVMIDLRLSNLVMVADSAMLSDDNLKLLEKKNLQYIVGARLGSISAKLLKQIDEQILRIDGDSIRLKLDNNRILVASYSASRATKDKSDREKQIKKAKTVLIKPQNILRRYKFLISKDKTYQLNQKLITKAEKLEGLKGYITNATELTNAEIINKYFSLWRVEQSFRMSKSDLKARPIFHTLKESIEAHLLIVFTALVISRYVEALTKISIQKILSILNCVKEIIVEDSVSKERTSKFTNLTPEAKNLLKTLDVWVT